MSDPLSKGLNITETGNETHSLIGYQPGNVNFAGSSLSAPVTSEEVAGQVKVATDPLSKTPEQLCDLMGELR